MKVLVTGGTGFIGNSLCRELLLSGHEVICIDNNFSGKPERISDLLLNNKFSYLEHDIINPINIKVDEIYNLACPASPIFYQKNPIYTIHTSVLGITNLLNLCAATGAKLLQASTSEIYGDPYEHPQCETYNGNVNLHGERSCYDEGKRCAEALCHAYKKQHGVDTRIARIFNTYGPGMRNDDGRVVPNFFESAINGKSIQIFGTGNQTRSFCYLTDTVQGLIKLMNSPVDTPVNIGNPEEITILDLAKKIIKLCDSKSDIACLPKQEDDPIRRCPDITKAISDLGWTPTISIDEGLRLYYKSQYEKEYSSHSSR